MTHSMQVLIDDFFELNFGLHGLHTDVLRQAAFRRTIGPATGDVPAVPEHMNWSPHLERPAVDEIEAVSVRGVG